MKEKTKNEHNNETQPTQDFWLGFAIAGIGIGIGSIITSLVYKILI